MREFADASGKAWIASFREQVGPDYKGRYHLVFTPADGDETSLSLHDVRWNSERTADRTLATMSGVELRRRLRSARARGVRAAS
jgi:hypothetical protein